MMGSYDFIMGVLTCGMAMIVIVALTIAVVVSLVATRKSGSRRAS